MFAIIDFGAREGVGATAPPQLASNVIDSSAITDRPALARSARGISARLSSKHRAPLEVSSLCMIVWPPEAYMVIGDRLKALREYKKMSQGDIERRTGLLRCYISRVENGHTVPAIETLEKMARAMEVPMYQLFYEGENPPAPDLPKMAGAGWGSSGRDARILKRFRRLIGKADKNDLKLFLFVAQKMSQRKRRAAKSRAS
jgi:transcriptional regulator with XRE-family HTH domain